MHFSATLARLAVAQLRFYKLHITTRAPQHFPVPSPSHSSFHVLRCAMLCCASWQDKDILKKRQAAIYGVDERSQIRRSYENPVVQHLYEAFLGEPASHEVGTHRRGW